MDAIKPCGRAFGNSPDVGLGPRLASAWRLARRRSALSCRTPSDATAGARRRRGRRTWLWAPIILALAAATAQAAEAPIVPGVYDELLLGYAPATHTLTGYFHSETGGG